MEFVFCVMGFSGFSLTPVTTTKILEKGRGIFVLCNEFFWV
jgi:hypothetical protein